VTDLQLYKEIISLPADQFGAAKGLNGCATGQTPLSRQAYRCLFQNRAGWKPTGLARSITMSGRLISTGLTRTI
jgi:hypothetical protein